MPRRVRFALAAVALALPPAARADAPAADFAPLEKLADEQLQATDTPGGGIAVGRGGGVVSGRALGAAGAETKEPVRPEMLSRLGSTTKMFVAAARVGLAEEGRLKLDEPIGSVVPGLKPRF